MQLELEQLPHTVESFGVDIKYTAGLVWVGPPPKLDENCDGEQFSSPSSFGAFSLHSTDFPRLVGNVILPFITKRGFTEDDFGRLVGKMAYLELLIHFLAPTS